MKKLKGISGHMYNPMTGTIDTIVDGEIKAQEVLHEPRTPKVEFVIVGNVVHNSALSYANGKATPWKSNRGR